MKRIKRYELCVEDFYQDFYYDETSYSKIRYKTGTRKISIGSEAGYIEYHKDGNPSRYRVRSPTLNRIICVHHIVWLLNHPYDIFDTSKNVIDHLDGNPLNNNILNLRKTVIAKNSRNKRKRFNNKSGKTGVSYRNSCGKHCWVAFWNTEDGIKKTKSFSIKKYGNDRARELAIEYRDNMIAELNLLGYGFTERHINFSSEELWEE